MALQGAFTELVEKFQRLVEVASDLRVNTVEDPPLRDKPLFVDWLADTVVHFESLAEQGLSAANRAAIAAGYPVDLERLREQQIATQRAFNDLSRIFNSELLARPGLSELKRIGSERSIEWESWTEAFIQSVARCEQPIFEASEALFRCWQEMVERIGMNSISVQTKAVGQEITVPASELEEVIERVG
ncbi:MAG TPA: hypothetical protein VF383_15885 [Candidatus Dormibacteraeota bacterium]